MLAAAIWFAGISAVYALPCVVQEVVDQFVWENRTRFIDPDKVVNIRLKDGTPRAKIAPDLKALGVRVIGSDPENVHLVGAVDGEALAQLSRLPFVDEVSRGFPDARFEVYRGGRPRFRKPKRAPSDGKDHEARVWAAMPKVDPDNRTPAELRALARQRGLTIVLDEHAPATALERKNREVLYGAKIFYAADLDHSGAIVRLPGVVLHLSDSPQGFRVRGEANPMLGKGHARVVHDKVTEMTWISEVGPGFAPKSVAGTAIVPGIRDLAALQNRLQTKINRFLAGEIRAIDATTRSELVTLFGAFLTESSARFPKGFVLKYAHARQTGDYSDILLSQRITAESLVDEAVSALVTARSGSDGRARIGNTAYFDALVDGKAPQSPHLLGALLTNPAEILVQEQIPIQKRNGQNVEFRVDVVGGQILQSRLRYGFQTLPRERSAAEGHVSRFLTRLGPEARQFSGGVDVCLLEDGSFRIIETNGGNESGFLYAYQEPVSANQAVSQLTGKNTPLVASLETVRAQSIEKQAEFLRGFPRRFRDEYSTIAQVPRQELFYQLVEGIVSRSLALDRAGRARTAGDIRRLMRLADMERDQTARETVQSAHDQLSIPLPDN